MLWLITLAVTTLDRRILCIRQVFAYTREDAETEGLCQTVAAFADRKMVRVRTLSTVPAEMAVN